MGRRGSLPSSCRACVLAGISPLLFSEAGHPADWFGNLNGTGTVESSIPQLSSLILELSSELPDQLAETEIGGRETGWGRNKMVGCAFSLTPVAWCSAHWTHIAK